MVPAIGDVRHFLDCSAVGEDIPLQIQIVRKVITAANARCDIENSMFL